LICQLDEEQPLELRVASDCLSSADLFQDIDEILGVVRLAGQVWIRMIIENFKLCRKTVGKFQVMPDKISFNAGIVRVSY
jgi:hypothetical protein